MWTRVRFAALTLVSVVLAIPASAQWATNVNNINSTNTGNVGIGTTTPIVKLQVSGTTVVGGEGSSSGAVRLAMGAAGADFGSIGYGYLPTATAFTYQYQSGCSCDPASQIYFNNGQVQFRIAAAGANGNNITWATPVSIAANGRLGVGTTTPTQLLDVNGDANISGNIVVGGNIAAKYQDVAEWVPSREPLSAGTVVILDPDHTNRIMASASPYDTRIAGVVSANPGLILGEGAADKEKIATTGRVRVKVDATSQPIHIGDLLVTSSMEGLAMVSQPVMIGETKIHRPGTIIGKALEPLASGRGEILVLLSLQ